MNDSLKNLTHQQLLDRLAALTARLTEGRGFDKGHEFCKIDIEEIQAEIEKRKRTGESFQTENP